MMNWQQYLNTLIVHLSFLSEVFEQHFTFMALHFAIHNWELVQELLIFFQIHSSQGKSLAACFGPALSCTSSGTIV